ncbi:MAG: S9 family peptidase [Acidobacteriaceae bacterium]
MKKLVIVLHLTALALPAISQTRRFSADDLPKIVRISDPQISPDSKSIAIVVARANMKEDRYDSAISLVDIATRQLRVLTQERSGVTAPRWSPTGDRLAFLAPDPNKHAQIFVLPLAGGEAQQLTESKTSVTLLAWKPDGSALAYAAADEEPEKKGEAKFEDAFEVGNNNYLERSRLLPTHLWSVSVADRSMQRLTEGSWSLPSHLAPSGPPSQISFTPDGKSLVFVKALSPITGDSDTSRVTLLDVASKALRPLTSATVSESNPLLSPDGSEVAYSFPREGKRHNEETVYIAPIAGGAGADAAFALDHGVGLVGWFPDGQSLLVAGNDGTHTAFWVQPLKGPAKRLEMGAINPSAAAAVARDGGIAFTATSATQPAELFYLARTGDTPVQLTHLQTVTEGVDLGRQETVRWKSNTFDVDGVLTYPPGYAAGKKLPLVLYLHGGPTAASLETFSTASQILAAQGWLVFEPNYRGSNNEGNAFETAIVKDAGAGPGRDVMAGLAMLEKRGLVDETKIAVSGWSYGGYMTSWLLGNYPETWRAAVAGAPVTDIVDQYTLSDNNALRAAQYGPSPYVGDNLKSYAVQSPITSAWRIKAPTLILSDVGDWRVTTTQAYKLFHALKDNNIPVKFIAYPVPGHSPADPIRYRDVWRRWSAWLHLYLDSGVAAVPKSS